MEKTKRGKARQMLQRAFKSTQTVLVGSVTAACKYPILSTHDATKKSSKKIPGRRRTLGRWIRFSLLHVDFAL